MLSKVQKAAAKGCPMASGTKLTSSDGVVGTVTSNNSVSLNFPQNYIKKHGNSLFPMQNQKLQMRLGVNTQAQDPQMMSPTGVKPGSISTGTTPRLNLTPPPPYPLPLLPHPGSIDNTNIQQMDIVTKNTSKLNISDSTMIVDLDSDELQGKSSNKNAPVVKRLAKKSTSSAIDFKQPPAAATRRQVALAQKKHNMVDKFLENFDPESSVREKRKLTRKVNNSYVRKVPGALYDEVGVHIATGLDMCDCLQRQCGGCHFSCHKCGSPKCGTECRCNRKFVYDQIEYHGCDYVIKNPLLKL